MALKAHGTIAAYLSDAITLDVEHLGTVQEVWDYLHKRFRGTNISAMTFFPMDELSEQRWDGDPDALESHIARFTAAKSKLIGMNPKFDPQWAPFVLRSLPLTEMWKSFKTSYLNSLKDDEEGEEFVIQLSDIARRLTFDALQRRHDNLVESAHRARDTKHNSTTTSSNKFFCTFHKANKSHGTKDCVRLNGGTSKDRSGRSKEKANKAQDEDDEGTRADDSEENAYTANLSRRVAVDTGIKCSSRAYIAFVNHPVHAYSGITKNPTNKPRVLDSGASKHMTPNRKWFIEDSFKILNPPRQVLLGDDSFVDATGIGTMVLTESRKGIDAHFEFPNTLYVPKFTVALISVRQLARHGMVSCFKETTCSVIDNRNITALQGQLIGGLYLLNAKPISASTRSLASLDINILHHRMGHVGINTLEKMVKDGKIENVESLTGTPVFCEPCVHGKIKKLPFKHRHLDEVYSVE